MKTKPIHQKMKTYILLHAAIVILFVAADSIISSKSERVRSEINEIIEQNSLLEAELRDLQDELAFIKTDEGIELYARASGMSMPGEVHYTSPRK